jgi:hypothetical protein
MHGDNSRAKVFSFAKRAYRRSATVIDRRYNGRGGGAGLLFGDGDAGVDG